MKKIIFGLIITGFMCLSAYEHETLLCNDILNKIDALKAMKQAKEDGNADLFQRFLLGLSGTVYYSGGMNGEVRIVDIKQSIEVLRKKLPTCNPY